MLEKTKTKIDGLLKSATDPEEIEILGQCAKEIAGEIERDGEREDLIKRQAERIRTAYLSTPGTQKDQPEGGKEERKKETMAEIYSRLFGKK